MTSDHPPIGDEHASNPKKSPEDSEANVVWTFRGYRLKPSEFNTAMVHFFRAEIQRANVWRTRLDATTNWAVVATGASLTIAFSPSGFHGVILLNVLLVTMFLFIEARRYRYYELWSYRVRLMETDFYAAMLVPPFQPAPDWAESLAEHLLHPQFPISIWEAIGRRLRRNYLYIYMVLGLAWIAKVAVIPTTIMSWDDLASRAAIGGISGQSVALVVLVFIVVIIITGLLTAGLHQATGEVLPHFAVEGGAAVNSKGSPSGETPTRPWFRHSRRRQQLLALIITDNAQAVSDNILENMRRGVTSMPGTGMYTGASHSVLICALTITEVNHLKKLVNDVDPNAFMIVTPAQEVLGRGFVPLTQK